ncbi:MAG: hypothetical protein IPN87_00725 [Saprospiraceae bacterium]|nr:hypothetical protein [Candidatus Brachybacter algidus]
MTDKWIPRQGTPNWQPLHMGTGGLALAAGVAGAGLSIGQAFNDIY